jgi:GT2 family glycosyltransferase
MNKTSIVIPVYNHWDLVENLIADLEKFEIDNIDEVVICDNGSEEQRVLKSGLPIKYLRSEKNLGFTLASNFGLKKVRQGDDRMVFLISTDVRIYSKFIDRASDILFGAQPALLGNRHITFDSGWNTFDGITFDYLEGWFLGATSEGWRYLGYFDEAYSPFDYEDIDLSTTAKQKGYKLVSLNNPNIIHLGAQTIGFNPEREAITIRNKEYFRKKWVK